jgi:two-component system chemotaxis response regulator CheY
MKKILIVDDSAFMRNVLKDIITGDGKKPSLSNEIEIFEADGKEAALILAKKEKPDVILLDIVMKESEMEGVEFIMDANEFFDLSKIIMITSIAHMDIMDTCKNLGVKFYLQKPFDQKEVIDSIKEVIG